MEKENKKKKYASSTDVARLAGVSQSAVSRTFRNNAPVSEAIRKKVLKAAQELNYQPSAIPGIMLNNRSRLVGLVIGGLYNPHYADILELLVMNLQAEGWQTLLVHVNSGYSLDEVVPRLLSYRVDAVVSALSIIDEKVAEILSGLNIPIISFNTIVSGKSIISISCDNYLGGEMVARHLVEAGGKTFAYLGGPHQSPAAIERGRGFSQTLSELNQQAPVTIEAGFEYESGRKAVRELFSGQDRGVDAIFCSNDLVAFGAMDVLRSEFHLRVPEDILMVGFDNVEQAAWQGYSLTSVVHDREQMVKKALNILRCINDNEKLPGSLEIVAPSMVIRSSTSRNT